MLNMVAHLRRLNILFSSNLVIDCGRVREIQRDKRTATRKLVSTWCSRANAKVRLYYASTFSRFAHLQSTHFIVYFIFSLNESNVQDELVVFSLACV